MTSTPSPTLSDLVLIAGLWLPRDVWDDVTAELVRLGHRVIVPPLPGVDVTSPSADLDAQLAAVLAAVDSARRPVVVGHSAASALAWCAADRRPTDVARVVMIGGFPVPDGGTYADFFPIVDDAMPFPGWDRFEGPDAADLDADARGRVTDTAVPVPRAVAQSTVALTDQRRLDVGVTMVCPEYSPAEARAWVEAGDLPELAQVRDVSYVDIDSGHWPMITRPRELAQILARVVRDAEGDLP